MDSKIPKPSGLKRPAVAMFDFGGLNDNQQKKPQPLTEINHKAFASFKFTKTTTQKRAASPEIFRPKPVEMPNNIRRSKSAMDMRAKHGAKEPLRGGTKRFQPILDAIPNKRMKPTVSQPAKQQLPIKTEEKKKAILSTLKSSSEITVAAKKPTLTRTVSKTVSRVANTSSKTAGKPPVAKPAPATKNIAAIRKPAPYDFKARHALLAEKFELLKAKHEQQKEMMSSLEEQNELSEQREKELLDKLEAAEKQFFEANETNEKLKLRVQELNEINSSLTTKNTALAASLTVTSEELSELKVKHEKLEKTALKHEILKVKAADLEVNLEQATNKLTLSQNQLYNINIERMVLHNMVLDLRGNIRVFARVRPPICNEQEKAVCGWFFTDETALEIHSNEILPSGGGRKQMKHDFAFDHVFNPSTTQDEIFEMVAPLIQSAMDGYNVCIFAYGQTGSGKTFTMDGVAGSLGIIPRTVELLFNSIKTAEILGWTYKITASFLEIYNEVLYDLLSITDKEIEIRMANAKSKTEIYVSNITETEVSTDTQLYDLMRVARSNRSTASTAGNERSSRSHAVTRLEIVGRHASRPDTLVGFINLVDLAGSESPKTSQRMEETKSINRSLSELSNVILALVQKNEHIPYRNSKLTHLLMPSLGGNSKTLMFVNVSPFQEHFVESVKSLRFASQVNSCKLAKAKRNRQLNVSNAV